MIAVFSFCASDKNQAVKLAQWIRRLGGVDRHQCLIVHPGNTDTHGIEEPLREAFDYTEVLRYDAQLSGWPQGANEQHAKAAQFLLRHQKLTGPWLYVEADCVPTTPRWLDAIASAHQRAGRPMLGTLNNTVENGTNRVIGRHTVGVAVYPQDFARLCPLVKSVVSACAAYVAAKVTPPAFDCYYEAYTVPMTHVSPLIQHLWRTDSYREENGRIFCKFRTDYGVPNVVDPEAALIHGCKDATLLDIMESRLGVQPPALVPEILERTVAPPQQLAAPTTPPAPPPRATHLITKEEINAAPPVQSGQMPPFKPGSPEALRLIKLMDMKWQKFQAYCKSLGLRASKIPRDDMMNNVVLKEREMGIEPWTKTIPQPAPATPPAPVREWKSGDGSNTPMSDVTAKRMMALAQARRAVPA